MGERASAAEGQMSRQHKSVLGKIRPESDAAILSRCTRQKQMHCLLQNFQASTRSENSQEKSDHYDHKQYQKTRTAVVDAITAKRKAQQKLLPKVKWDEEEAKNT